MNNKKVYGKGVYQKCNYDSKGKCYKAWKNMLQRCYYKKLHEKCPTYIGCEVSKEWLYYENFAKWYYENYIKDYQIDKDIIGDGKLYSSKNCCFVPNKINSLLNDNTKKQNQYPVGVVKQGNKFRVRINTGKNSKKHVGYYDTIDEAETAYKKEKKQYIVSIFNDYILSEQIKEAIISKL